MSGGIWHEDAEHARAISTAPSLQPHDGHTTPDPDCKACALEASDE